jgi:hypothetical protein
VEELRPDITPVDVNLWQAVCIRFEAASRSHAGLKIILTRQSEQDFADLIAASPAVGLCPKTICRRRHPRRLAAS